MKTRYLIIASSLVAAFSVLFIYYYAWIAAARRWSRSPAAQGDVFLHTAEITLAVSLACLVVASIASCLKALRGRRR